MPTKPPIFRSSSWKSYDSRSKESLVYRKLYSYKWQKARLSFLASNPLCVMCESENRFTPADVVDHIVPHRGNEALFWNQSNWQPLCKRHHDRDKKRIEGVIRK